MHVINSHHNAPRMRGRGQSVDAKAAQYKVQIKALEAERLEQQLQLMEQVMSACTFNLLQWLSP